MVTERIHLVGESQAVDRIIRVIASRYWSCNTGMHGLFPSKDLVYCCLFSLILLNTDLNVLGILKGTGFTKMRKSTYVKNTLDRLAEMHNEFYRMNNVEISTGMQRQWKISIENLLSSCYDDVKREPFVFNIQGDRRVKAAQGVDGASRRDPGADTRPAGQASETASSKDMRHSTSQTPRIPSGYTQSGACASSSSAKSDILSNSDIASSLYNDITNAGKYAVVFQKTPELLHPDLRFLIYKNLELANSDCTLSTTTAQRDAPEENIDQAAIQHHGKSTGDSTSVPISGRVSFREIGRKDRDTTSLPHAQRFEYWAAVVYDDRSFLNLALWKFTAIAECRKLINSRQRTRLFGRKDASSETKNTPPSNESISPFNRHSSSLSYPNPFAKKPGKKGYHRSMLLDDALVPIGGSSNFEKASKLIFGAPEVYSLLHSVAHLLSGFNCGNSEFYSMRLRLHNGNNCVLSSPSKEFIHKFKDTVNILASCKSKEPMANLEGNVDYGWDSINKIKEGYPNLVSNNDTSISPSSSAGIPKRRDSYDSLYIPGYNSDITGYLSRVSNTNDHDLVPMSTGQVASSATDVTEVSNLSDNFPNRRSANMAGKSSSDGDTNTVASPKHLSHLKKIFGKRKPFLSKCKICVWRPIPPPTDRLSDNTPEKQLEGFKHRLMYIEDSLFEHSVHRAPVEEYHKNRNAFGSLALSNWIYKQHYLINEFEKYKVYVEVLTEIVSKGSGVKEST